MITFYNGIYMILLGIYFILLKNFNMSANFDVISELWGFFHRYSYKIAYLFFLFNILLGIFFISIGIFIIYLSDFIYKRKEKMTWVVLFLGGITTWGGILIMSILFRNIYLIILSFIGWLSFIFGMLLPIKYYIEKPYREY